METETVDALERRWQAFRDRFARARAEIGKAIFGYDDLVTEILVAVYSQGHVLLEGVPGLGKTSLVKALGRVLDLSFGRVQCTPDLMPADILGTHIVGEDGSGRRAMRFERGPVFKHLLLMDEINRATPKTQAALLEVMQERCVTTGGERLELPAPFFVLATQNPIEMEGTYPLPEAQLDRFFFKLRVGFPTKETLLEISRRTTGFHEPELSAVVTGAELLVDQESLTRVPVAEPIADFAASLVLASHPGGAKPLERVRRYVAYGASPRGLQALIRAARAWCLLAGRTAVSLDDVRQAARPAFRHRIMLNFEGEAEALDIDRLIDEIVQSVPGPAGGTA